MKTIHSDKAPKAVGPYSQAIMTDQFVFCSGQIGINPETGILVEGIEDQIRQVMENLTQVLKTSGTTLGNVVKTTIFLTDMNDYAKVNEIYGSFFTDHKPARSTVQVAALPLGALVEVEMIAVR